MKRILNIALFSLVLFTDAASAREDVKYQPKKFSGKSLDNKSYSAKAYRSDKVAKDKEFKRSSKKTAGFWSFFGLGKQKEHAVLPEQELKKDKNYQPDERVTLKVKQPETKTLSDEKELNSATDVKSKAYKPSDKKRGHDPLLEPRQGIKAPIIKNDEQ